MTFSDMFSPAAREQSERMASWRGPRARRWCKRRPQGRRNRSSTAAPEPPIVTTLPFRRCGNISDMVRACTLVVPWINCHATVMNKEIIDWLHPASNVSRCERCYGNYLVVQRYFRAWNASRLGGPTLDRRYDVTTLEGGEITEAELKRMVRWVCDQLGCEMPSEGDDDLLPAA